MILISNIYINYDERHIKKPKIDETLLIVKKFNEKKIYLEPQRKIFTNYMMTVKNINHFEIIGKDDILNLKHDNFIIVCLNNPKYQFKIKPREDNEQCRKNYEGYIEVEKIRYDDFLVRFLKKND